MAIGQQIKKYQAEKAARAEANVAVADEPAPVIPAPDTSDSAPMTQIDFLAAMKLLLADIRSSNVPPESKERLALEAERLSLEHQRLKREMPENKQAPGISVYSYPEGELKHPKPDLKCKVYWVGRETETDMLTPVEVDLLNRLQPGDYRVTKSDGTEIPFRVSAKYGDRIDPITHHEELRELSVWFPCKEADQRQNHGSMVQYLQQALGDRIPSNAELLAEVDRLRAELAGARG